MPQYEGQRFGNYRLMRLLGKGGFAEVYLAEHLYLKNYAAVKILHGSFSEKDEQLFLSESQTLAQLMHPNIVRVREFAIERTTPFLVMDYAPGGTLAQRYPRGFCLSLDLVVNHIKQVAAALQYAHNRGIIHRDVKPENLFQGAEQIMLGDFGISLHTPSGNISDNQQWAGTLPYIAPEQLQGKAVFASDQYSLAIIAYKWLCGTLPFEGGNFANFAHQHLHVPPAPLREKDPSLPAGVEAVVLKALNKDPKERFVSVLAFARALERAADQLSLSDQRSDTSQTATPDAPADTFPRRLFLSAASTDDVTQLKADLNMRDVTVLEAASSQDEEQVRQEVRAAQVMLLVLSPQTRSSPEVKEHLRIADLYRRPVLCLWMAGAEMAEVLPAGVADAPVVDARGSSYHTAIDDVLHFLERERRGVLPPEVVSSEVAFEPRNPYKGLHAFTQNDRLDFFGREALVQEMKELVQHMLIPAPPGTPAQRLLAVVGPSGSGKSSVVMAGLLPLLQDGALPMSELWLYPDSILPGKHPLDALAYALGPHVPDKSVQEVREMLGKEGGFGLHQIALSLAHQETYIVLFVDQFEELFAQDVTEQERRQFIDLLVTAVSEQRGHVLILLTLRADCYDQPLAYPDLARLIQQHQCTVLPMESQDLRAVIERPALASDVRLIFDEDLIGDLLFEMRGQAGSLPLLEFTLDQLFHHRRERRLTRRAYEEIGGVRGALSHHAEATYAALPQEKQRHLTRALFTRLIQPGEVGQAPIRRRAELSEFVLEDEKQTRLLRETIDAFTDARLLTSNQVAGITTLEVSHEALLHEWPRLLKWIDEAREDIRLQQALRNDVAEWEQRGKPKDRLYRGTQLKESLAWRARNTTSASEQSFLRASTARRMQGRLSVLLIALLLLGLLVPAGVLIQQQTASSIIVTNLNDGGAGSLRQAIADAKPGFSIFIAANLKGTLTLTQSLEFAKNVTIHGPGAQALKIGGNRGAGNDSLIKVFKNVSVTFSDLTFSDTNPHQKSVFYNQGSLTLQRCIVTGNTFSNDTSSGGADEQAGYSSALSNDGGTLTLLNSTVSNNVDVSFNADGAIYSSVGNVIIANSQLINNTVNSQALGQKGGAISSYASELTITNTTISGNKVIDDQREASNSEGGGIYIQEGSAIITNSIITNNTVQSHGRSFGGGISAYNVSTIKLIKSRVSNNKVTSYAVAGGGGIASQQSTLTLIDSTVSGNTIAASTATDGGGIYSATDPPDKPGSLTITGTVVSNNTSQSQGIAFAGGINDEDTLTLTDSSILDNTLMSSTTNGQSFGGGILALGLSTLNGCTIARNKVINKNGPAYGGGITAIHSNSASLPATVHMRMKNCTIAGNSVSGSKRTAEGGGVVANLESVIDFCTIYGNTAESDGGGIVGTEKVTMKNSLVAQNSASRAPDITGEIITGGYNLIQRFAGATFLDPDKMHKLDRSGEHFPRLDLDSQLRANGGLTFTLALLATSPAVNQIPATACDVPTDQRGVKRPQQGSCDIGAYEYQPMS